MQPTVDSESSERPGHVAPSAASVLGSESVAESNIIEPTIDTRSNRSSRPRAPMLVANMVKRRKLENSSAFTEYQQLYGGHSWVDLIHELICRDKTLEEAEKQHKRDEETIRLLKGKNKNLMQSQRRIGKTAAKWKDQAKTLVKRTIGKTQKHEILHAKDSTEAKLVDQRLSILRTGADGDGRYLTVPSRVSLAIRRNLSNIACADLGLVILDNASRWTVARAEVQSGAALMAAGRAIHKTMVEEMLDESSANEPSLHVHFVTQDATNSLRRKMTALILHSAWCYLPSDDASDFNFDWKVFHTFHGVADVHSVTDSSALGTVALTHKMLDSLACPSIKSLVDMKLKSECPWQ